MSVLTSVSGFPRIGQNRELKKIIEAYWKGVATLDDVRATAKELRAKHWKLQQEAGIDLIPSKRRCSPWAAATKETRATSPRCR